MPSEKKMAHGFLSGQMDGPERLYQRILNMPIGPLPFKGGGTGVSPHNDQATTYSRNF